MAHYWFLSTKYRRNSSLVLIACFLAFFVILLGAYTRLTDAGLSCPDWPHCFGYITAPHTATQIEAAQLQFPNSAINVKKAWTEMTHRYFAGTEGVLILALALSLLIRSKAKHIKTTLISVALILLLFTQVMLGMLTVTEKLHPVIVLSHLITGITLLSLLWWAYLDLHLYDDSFIKPRETKIIPWAWIGFFILFVQIMLGGWVSTHYAGLACLDLPYCNGKLLPGIAWGSLNTDLISIQMLHRIGAMITATYLGILATTLLFNSAFRLIAFSIIALLILQVTLGVLNILWLRPIWIALMHQAIAIVLLMTMITLLVKSYLVTRDKRYVSWIA